MPYSSAKDAPDWVQKMGQKAAEQWISVFNDVFAKTNDEGRAFAAAGAAVKKRSMSDAGDVAGRILFVSAVAPEVQGTRARIAIIRTGSFMYRGKELNIQLSDLEDMVRNFSQYQGGELMFDYGHRSNNPASLEDDLAAGWFKALEIEKYADSEGGILWGVVDLNPPADEHVRTKRLRFSSAEFSQDYFHPEAKKKVGAFLHAVALTNRPFQERLPGAVLMSEQAAALMEEINRADTEGAGRGSDSSGQGTRPDSGNDNKGKTMSDTNDQNAVLLSQERERAAKLEAELKAANERHAKADTERVQLSQELAGVKKTNESIQQQLNDDKFDRIFDAAKSDRSGARVTEAEREPMKRLFSSYLAANDVEGFRKYLTERPVILPARPAGAPGAGKVAEDSAEAKFFAATAEIQKESTSDNRITFTQAAARVQRENPDLAKAYAEEQKRKAAAAGRPAGVTPSGEEV